MKLNNKNLVPFDQFMADMLYNTKKGYYMKSNPFGKNGDFITAPNVSIMFSEMIAIWCISFLKNKKDKKKISIVELGAGNGEMTFQIIKIFKKLSIKANFYIVEKSDHLIKIQKKKLSSYDVVWYKSVSNVTSKNNIFLANEVFDALPVKQFIKKKKSWFEVYVKKDFDRKLKYTNIEKNIKKIEKEFSINLSKNQKFIEFSIESYKLISQLAKKIKNSNSCLLIIDYGANHEKMTNSVQAVYKHKYIDIFDKPYLSDISYCPNFKLLKKIVEKNNLFVNGVTTQKKFLEKLGIVTRAEILSQNLSFSDKANIYYRLKRLIDEKYMGHLFKVMFVTKSKSSFNLGF